MNTMNTINVVEIADTTTMAVKQLVSFPDTQAGKVDALNLFTKLVNDAFDGEDRPSIEQCIDEGYFECNSYWVGIITSVPVEDTEKSFILEPTPAQREKDRAAQDAVKTLEQAIGLRKYPETDKGSLGGNGPKGSFTGSEDGGVDDLDR